MGRLLTLLRPKGGFSPLDLPGLALWLDASDESTITHDTGAVSQWDDKSGNARHAAQATANDQPATGVNTRNGKNVITFDGTDDNLRAPFATLPQPNTFLMAFQRTNTGYLFDGNLGEARNAVLDNANWQVFAGLTFAPGRAVGTAFQLATIRFDGASSSLRVDGTLVNTGNAGTQGLAGLGIAESNAGGGNRAALQLGEVLVCGALSADDTAAAEAFLAEKWGVTLA